MNHHVRRVTGLGNAQPEHNPPRLQKLADEIRSQPKVTLTYFRPGKKKAGGAYVCVTGQLKKIDNHEGTLVLTGGERILIEDILEII